MKWKRKRIRRIWSINIEREYLYDRRWKGKGYYKLNNIIYELKNGKGKIKEY